MAGSRVEGLKSGKKNVDPDREITKGRQSPGGGNEISQNRRFNQQGQRMREQHSKSTKARAKMNSKRGEEPELNKEPDDRGDPGREKKSKKEKGSKGKGND
jgi:hypothetical protein